MSSVDVVSVTPVIENDKKQPQWKKLGNKRCHSEESIRRLSAHQMSQRFNSSNESNSRIADFQHSAKFITPVSICILLALVGVKSVQNNQNVGIVHKTLIHSYFEENMGKSDSDRILKNIVIVLYIVGGMIVFTMIIFLLYKYKYNKIIIGIIHLSLFALLSYGSYQYIKDLLAVLNVAMDFITVIILLWNFLVVGIICQFVGGPSTLRHLYQILCCSLFAFLFIKYLPFWVLLVILIIMAVYDVFTVLCPKGPLRLLVNMAEERNEPLFPALIYSSTVPSKSDVQTIQLQQMNQNNMSKGTPGEEGHQSVASNLDRLSSVASNLDRLSSVNATSTQRLVSPLPEQNIKEESHHGLGLGDFCMYSLMVGEVSTFHDWNITIACFFAVLTGFCITLILHSIYRKALPALPISITIGLIFSFATKYVIQPFMDEATLDQVFI